MRDMALFILNVGLSTSGKSISRPVPCNWVYELNSLNGKNYSQGFQDGIIREIFSHIGTTNRHFVEFGFGYYPAEQIHTRYNSSGLNTANLYWQGWHGTYFDAIIENKEFNIIKAVLTESTIVHHFQQAGIPYEVDYVSIDVDSVDLWLLKGLLENGKYRPRLISVEYNSHFAADMMISMQPEWHPWTKRSIYGASAAAINYIAQLSGYTVVHVMRHLDVFLIRNDVLGTACSIPPSFAELVNGKVPEMVFPPCDAEDLQRIVDVPAFLAYPSNASYANAVARMAVQRLKSEFGLSICTEGLV